MDGGGNLLIFGVLAAVALGALWKPGIALSILGLIVFLIGALPLIGLVRVPGGYAMAVIGMAAFPTAVLGIFVMAFGRLVSVVERILAQLRQAAPASPSTLSQPRRREPSFENDDPHREDERSLRLVR